MARQGHINAAGGFLRALKQPGGPGGQGFGAPQLPVKELLLFLTDRPRTLAEAADELVLNEVVVVRAVENLRGLGLVSVEATHDEDVVALTDLGHEVAHQSRVE